MVDVSCRHRSLLILVLGGHSNCTLAITDKQGEAKLQQALGKKERQKLIATLTILQRVSPWRGLPNLERTFQCFLQ